MNKNTPLITIVVITYNSEKFVIETLESIKKQTYKNIELIITDDCSTDSTVKICKKWIEKENIHNTQLITSEINTGIASNCNRGFFAAKGQWIKIIAGDDTLLPDCLEKFVKFVETHKDARICHAKVHCYKNKFKDDCKLHDFKLPSSPFTRIRPNAHAQLLMLVLYNPIFAASVFIERQLFVEIGGYDEKLPNHEDYPMWIKVTKKGYGIYFMDEYVANYRINSSSVVGTAIKTKLYGFYKENEKVYNIYLKKIAPFYLKIINRYQYYIISILDYCGLTKHTTFNKLLIGTLLIPYFLYKLYK